MKSQYTVQIFLAEFLVLSWDFLVVDNYTAVSTDWLSVLIVLALPWIISTATHFLCSWWIGYAKQEFHGPMNSSKRGLGIASNSWQLFHWIAYSFHSIFVYNIAVVFQLIVNEMCRIINVQCIVWILFIFTRKIILNNL